MKFLDYIKGQRKGHDAHRIEKDSMADPFLYEAIEGFDSINDKHFERITDIQKRIREKKYSTRKQSYTWRSVAATVAVLLIAGTYFLSDFHKPGLYAQEIKPQEIIDLYVPQAYYEENIVPIAKKNAEVIKKAYQPQINKFKVDAKINPNISEEELNDLSKKTQDTSKNVVFDIFAPSDF